MRVGLSTASLFRRKYNEEALPFFDCIGVKTAEVFLGTFCEYDPAYGKKLTSVKGDVDVHSIHVLNTQFEPQLFNQNPRARADSFGWLEKALLCANELGATKYTFHGTARMKRASRDPKNDNFSAMIEGVRAISDFCQSYDVDLCLENVEWSTYNRPGVFEKIAEGVPSLLGVLDIKQARISEYPYEEYLQEMGERIATVHISDINAEGKMCLPGKGVFDFETLIKRLRDVNCHAPLLIEVYEKDYEKEEELKISCDYIAELIDKIK